MNVATRSKLIIRTSLLLLIIFMAIGYKQHISKLLPINTFGVNQYHERAEVYRKYLVAIFLWLTPLSITAAGFLSSINGVNQLLERFIQIWNKLPRWIFFALIPLVGQIIMLVWFCTDSQVGANEFGENPKGVN